MNATQAALLATLEALAAVAGGRTVRASQRWLANMMDRTPTTIRTAAHALESQGFLSITPGTGRGVNSYTLTQSKIDPTKSPLGDGLPDCFRARDLRAAGALWQVVEKDHIYTLHELSALACVGKPAVRERIVRLMALAVPPVEELSPGRRGVRRFRFRELSAEDRASIIAGLEDRDGRWRVRPRAETEERYDREREAFTHGRQDGEYVVLAWALLAQCEVDDDGCLLFQGELRGDCYVPVPGRSYVAGHRVVYQALRGPVPVGYDVHHECGVRRCLNVKHLEVLSEAEHHARHRLLDEVNKILEDVCSVAA
jgi:hypothetical protein